MGHCAARPQSPAFCRVSRAIHHVGNHRTANSNGDDFEQRAATRVITTLRVKYCLNPVLRVGGNAAVYAATRCNGNEFAVKMNPPEPNRATPSLCGLRSFAQIRGPAPGPSESFSAANRTSSWPKNQAISLRPAAQSCRGSPAILLAGIRCPVTTPSPALDDPARLRMERDLFLHLLQLGAAQDLTAFLRDALALMVRVTQARKGYIELYGREGAGLPQFSIGSGLSADELREVRRSLSTGIIAEALSTGRTISTASAVEDPRYSGHSSVQAQGIRAVLCAPIGTPSIGVVYLTERPRTGPFAKDDVDCAELFARHVSPVAALLLAREEQAAESDHTADLRTKLDASRIAGKSRALAEVFRMLVVAKDVALPVIFTGESGTGKSSFAQALHASSPRARAPFVEINCAALPESLFENELFGADEGGHSGAARRRILGKVDAAKGGTLFFDEVGDLPLAVQGKLLLFLQSKRYYRLGGSVPVEADVRILAATNKDPEELVQAKLFREDLYYRLNVLRVHIPPLRERREDIEPIAEAVVRAIGGSERRELTLTRAARIALGEGEWPGNVRQIENVLQRAWAISASEGSVTIEPRHLFPDKRPSAAPGGDEETYEDAIRRFQRSFLQQALARRGWNVSETARRIGIARSHLNDLIRAHRLVRGA